MTHYTSWSTTDSENDDADTRINWAEGQNASTVNNSARAMMAALKEFMDDNGTFATSSGSANAYEITPPSGNAPSSYAEPLRYCVVPHQTNTGAATLKVGALSAKSLRITSGTALSSGEIVQNRPFIATYYAAQDEFLISQTIPDTDTDSGVLIGDDPTWTGTHTFSNTISASAGIDSSGGTTTVGTLAGTIDAGSATSLEIPNSATPTVNANGEIAIDTTVTDFSHGVMKYYSGEEMGVLAMPIAQFTSPTDNYVVAYNATNDEFELIDGALDQTANFTWTGAHDFGGATSLEIPNSTSPTVNTNGQIAIDTSVADFSHGILKYYSGEEMMVVAMPAAQFVSPTDDYIVKYNSSSNEFELQIDDTAASGLGQVAEDTSPQLGGDLDTNSFHIQFDDAHGIKDDSGNELLIFQKATSAQNYFQIYNSTGDVVFEATGSDTNVSMDLQTKGSGIVEINGVEAVTISGTQTLTNKTLTSPTINGGTFDNVTVAGDVIHTGDTDNKIAFGTDTQSYETGASSRLDISNSGVRMGGANARVTTILDEDAMTSNSATALATQQSIKAYVDANTGGSSFTNITVADDIIHNADADTLISFGTDTIDFQTGGGSRVDLSDSGFRLGGANARVNAILDQDDMSSNSATSLATQQSIKAYVDTDATTTANGTVELATAAEYSDDTQGAKALTPQYVWDAMAEQTLTDGATITIDFDNGFDFTVTLGGNRTMGAPSNALVGKKGRLRILQDATGSRTLSWNAVFYFANNTAVTLSTGANDEDILYYDIVTTSKIIITASALDID
jgi:hypothetical protein